MKFNITLILLLVLLLNSELQAQSSTPELDVSLTETTRHIRFLASDELLGRMTGEQGNHAAARYLAEHFREYGLKSFDDHNDFYQSLPLYQNVVHPGSQIIIGSDTLHHRQHIIPISGSLETFSTSVIYIENILGVDGTLSADIDLKELNGKILVTEFGDGTEGGFQSQFRYSAIKRALIAKTGAVALVERYQGNTQFGLIANYLMHPRLTRGDINNEVVFNHFIIDAGSIGTSFTADDSFMVTSAGVQQKEVIANNVVGYIEGSDPELKDEYITLMAHFDHIGARMRSGISPADTINNGARDNGMGVVGLLVAAKGLAQNPPKRSVIILAVNAEESGMHGSIHFVANPTVDLRKIKFVMNVDSGGYNDTSLITLVGHGRTTGDSIIAEAVKAVGLTMLPDPSPEQNLFNRSDNVHFARAGVPAPTFSPGFTAFNEELMKFYHQPADEADELFDFEYLNNFARAYAHTTRALANTSIELKWVSGDDYESAYNKLHDISVE